MSAAAVVTAALAPLVHGSLDKENCHPDDIHPTLSSVAVKCVSAVRPPLPPPPPLLSRRSSSSILRASVGHSNSGPHSANAASATNAANRLSVAGRRKSVSFAPAMEQVRLFDSRDALKTTHNTNTAATSHITSTTDTTTSHTDDTSHTNHTTVDSSTDIPYQPPVTQQQHQQSPEWCEDEAECTSGTSVGGSGMAGEDSASESMDFTELLTSSSHCLSLSSLQSQSAVAAAGPPSSPSVDMELTALLQSLPALVTAASRAARRTSVNVTSTTNHATTATNTTSLTTSHQHKCEQHSTQRQSQQPADGSAQTTATTALSSASISDGSGESVDPP